ncbi:MAG: hypothetical protein SVS15_09175 [Thermodesulfobacteriota bacterium]|nr:hypothetical protein [Thermodesulfobacteriota bacterium]
MKHIQYGGEIWKSKFKDYHPEMLDLLTSKDHLIVLSHGKLPYKVVLGVPHQAAVGEDCICEKSNKRHCCKNRKGRDSDENAAGYALVAYSSLKEHDIPCKLVIMAHSTGDDPNKDKDTDYCKEIFKDHAKLLMECHGAGSKRKYDLELSAGRNKLSSPMYFGRLLADSLEHRYELAVQKKHGEPEAFLIETGKDCGKLENPAKKTISLIEAGNKKIPALHLEAKSKFRIPEDEKDAVSDDGMVLGCALAQALMKWEVGS